MLHIVSYCWYDHLCFILFFYFTPNPTVVPAAEVILLSKPVMDYFCVYNGQLFIPVFILLTENYSCVTGYINCNKEDMTIMSGINKDDDNKRSDVILSIWECDKVDRRASKGNKERWYCGFYGNEFNICNSTKSLMQLTRSGGPRIYRCRGEIIPKYQRQFKALKKKKYQGIKRYQKGSCCRHRLILMQRTYQLILSQGK